MSLTLLSQLYAVKCGTTLFHQLQDATLNSNVQDLIETPVGGTMPLFNANNGERPEVTFGTHQLKTALTLCGVAGGSGGVAKLFGRKVVNLTGPAAVGGSVHYSWTSAASLALINQISAGNRQRAQAQLRVLFLKSGATSALTYAGTATLDAYTTAVENFVLGPIVIDGNVIEGTNDFTLSFNPAVEEPDDDYETQPVFAAVRATQPVISFSTTSPTIWALHNTEFNAGGTTPAKVNLIKLKNNLLRYGDADLEHILFEAGEGRIKCESIGGSKQLTRVSLICNSPDGGTTAPVTATVDNAIETT